MLHENIRQFRKAKGISQQEMAIELNVVRQTVSKWENGLSVPDADLLPRIADLLGVSVAQLLDVSGEKIDSQNLAQRLAEANQQLAQQKELTNLTRQASKKRGLILFFSFFAILSAQAIEEKIPCILAIGFCVFGAIAVLYRNLALLSYNPTDGFGDDRKLGIFRIATLFNLLFLVVCVGISILAAQNSSLLSAQNEKLLAIAMISILMLFVGIISPKLPYNRHTGLRLPWTVQDEETWNIAHRVLGLISLPAALLYPVCALNFSDFEMVTLCAMALWVGIPSTLSYLFFRKRIHA